MLKQPLPGRARRLFGGTCVAVIVAAASFAAWAAQPGVPAKTAETTPSPPPALLPPDVGSAPRDERESYRRISRIEYPQSAIAAKAEGVVYIAVHVAADGRVADAKVSSAMPMAKADFADAALAAIKTWTFNPRMVDGKPVVSDTIVPVAFSLDPDKPVKAEADPNLLDTIGVSPPQGGR